MSETRRSEREQVAEVLEYEAPAIAETSRTGRAVTSNFAPPPEPTAGWVSQLWSALRLRAQVPSPGDFAATGLTSDDVAIQLRRNCLYAFEHEQSVNKHLTEHLHLSDEQVHEFWLLLARELPFPITGTG